MGLFPAVKVEIAAVAVCLRIDMSAVRLTNNSVEADQRLDKNVSRETFRHKTNRNAFGSPG